MKTYQLQDIWTFAMSMEEKGRDFYAMVASNTNREREKELFLWLGNEEAKHEKLFQALHGKYAKKNSSFTVEEEFDEVLDALMRGGLLPDTSEVRDALQKNQGESLLAIIRIAMDVETNTILFYQALKSLVQDQQTQRALAKIVKEEEKHLVRLKNVRLDLDPLYAGIKYGKFF